MYADDMALVDLLQKDYINASAEYMKHVEELLCWCKNSTLILNRIKTKALVNIHTWQKLQLCL